MNYVMGIDGGGSTLRVIIITPDLNVLAESHGGTASPSLIGREAAVAHLHRHIQAALDLAGLSADQINGAGVGIAGASDTHSVEWLRAVLSPILPNAHLALSSDVEIALVGAHGRREGVLVLAGTGSVVFGVNPAGESVQVGGWGYLLGDEGSGYWLGLEALKAIARAFDGVEFETRLTGTLLHALQLETPKQLIHWLYHSSASRTAEIARLAPLVIHEAQHDPLAAGILALGVEHLTSQVIAAKNRLIMPDTPIAFAGGLLAQPNPYSISLLQSLHLSQFPEAKYPPVLGAALLALMRMSHAD